MRFTKFFLLCALTILTQNSLAAANSRTLINDEKTANAILGEHILNYQLSKESFPGTLTLTNTNGTYHLNAKQRDTSTQKSKDNNVFSIDGNIVEINSNSFKFTGTIFTKFNVDAAKQCTKKGTFYFAYIRVKGKPSRWRLLHNQHTCGNKVIRVEFLAHSNWKPPQAPTAQLKWGVGIITKNLVTKRGPFKILFPADGATTLYDKPNGSKVAHININLLGETFLPLGMNYKQLKYKSSLYGSLLILRHSGFIKTNVHPSDIIKMQSNAYVIKVFEVKSGFLKILPATMHHQAWVSINDLAKQGYQFSSWRDILLSNQSKDFTPSGKFALNVRSGAGADMKKITAVKGRKYKISLTGQTKGDWMEVKVRKLSSNCQKTIDKWTGWMKTLDASGYPNIKIRKSYGC